MPVASHFWDKSDKTAFVGSRIQDEASTVFFSESRTENNQRLKSAVRYGCLLLKWKD